MIYYLENKYRPVLLGLEVHRTTYNDLFELFDLNGWHPSDLIARKNFMRAWDLLKSHPGLHAEYYDNIECLLLLLATMSTQEVNEFIESFYWEGYHVRTY